MLIGKSIFLKVMEPEDWRAAWEVFARPDVWPEIVGDPALVIPSQFEAILLPQIPGCDARAFGIWTKAVDGEGFLEPPRLIGFCALTHISWINRRCVAGPFGIAVQDGQPPYARDVFEVLLRHVFLELNLNRIEGQILSGNAIMERLYQWAGMNEEGRKRDYFYQGGRYRDHLIYAMLRQEYLERNGEAP